MAEIAVELRKFELAASLLGAGATWFTTYCEFRRAYQGHTNEDTMRIVRRHLGQRWDEANSAGEILSSEQAHRLALDAITEFVSALESLPAGLTERQVQVLRLVSQGLSNAEIATRLKVSPRTVHAHLRAVFGKLGVATRTAAAREATKLSVF